MTACATVAAEEPKVVGGGECRGDDLARFKGRVVNDQLGAEILEVSGAKTIQFIQPGMMVTMEYRSDRVRVRINDDNRVESVNCG
jgi:hypothetical protein